MPIVNDYAHVREVYAQAAQLGVGLPVFCAEDRETLEAILAAVYEYGKEIGCDSLPIIPAWTSRYPARGQMKLVSACGNPRLGLELMFSDLRVFTGEGSPYKNLRVMPHLDHAFPWLDGDILEDYTQQFASVMCDASEKPFNENIRLTAQYVEKVRGRVVVEGAVDEIFEAGGQGEKNEPTTVAQASRFLRETGVDILVPNVGTEHRATAGKARYLPESARALKDALGSILCLHGTSSVGADQLGRLPGDGFVKINIYTTLAVNGGQAVARRVLDTLGNVFSPDQLEELVGQGVLGQAVLSPQYKLTKPPIRPKLDYVTNPGRRDAWFAAVKERCKDFLKALHYDKYAQ